MNYKATIEDGDKARFAAKEIWEMKRLGMHQGVTKSAIRTFRSRIKGYGLDVAQIEIIGDNKWLTVIQNASQKVPTVNRGS